MRPCPVFTLYYTRAHPPFQPRPSLGTELLSSPSSLLFFSLSLPLSPFYFTGKSYCKFIAFIFVAVRKAVPDFTLPRNIARAKFRS